MITSLDIKNSMIVSGSKDLSVKVWDIDRKKGWTFQGKHMNMITKVLMWDDTSAFSASIDRSIRYFDIKDVERSKHFMGHKKSIT